MNRECGRRERAWQAALALTLLVGCGNKIQQEYTLQVIGPVGDFYLKSATTIALEVNGREITRSNVSEGLPFSVVGGGVDVGGTNGMGAIKLRALDRAGNLVAYGETPAVELQLVDTTLRLFVQKPGTFGKTTSLLPSERNLVAAAPPAAPDAVTGLSVTVQTPLFGTGIFRADDMSPQTLGDAMYFYNPLQHEIDGADNAGTIGGMRQYRRDAAAIVGKDGNVYLFGGVASSMNDVTSGQPTSELDTLRVSRADFSAFRKINIDAKKSTVAEVARSGTALAEADAIYAFGGISGTTELDTVVALHPAAPDATSAFELLNLKMGAPRLGHTATATAYGSVPDILVFGGDQAAAAVAEVLIPPATTGAKPTFMRPAGDAGSARWDHGAVHLSDERVLLVGGRGPSGLLGDSVLYLGHERRLLTGPITLRTPRADFAAFTIGNDLVVAGGVGASGAPLADAEIYDIGKEGMPLRGTTPCQPRYHAAVAAMPNQSLVIIGGTEQAMDPTTKAMVEVPSAVIEIYQPTQ
jgi:hypothetical protein